jgi:muramidase (phage lysozyme)
MSANFEKLPLTSPQASLRHRRHRRTARWPRRWLLLTALGFVLAVALGYSAPLRLPGFFRLSQTPPLVMQGGDPYIRALMRTISASESNDLSPYTILYGGKHFRDLSRHPDVCQTIENGPNQGQCTTAAGRYQFLATTWVEKARDYHPQVYPQGDNWESQTYSFEPQFQDLVVYAWLTDANAWGVSIPRLLREGQLNTVLRLLSDTWTSLGYGQETNLLTPLLTTTYQQLLQEEQLATQTVDAPPVRTHSY